MDIKEALAIMQSDMALWDAASKVPSEDGKSLVLSLELPWGIGNVSVALEGMDNAEGKRNAVGAYAEYIRGLIETATSEEEISARARQRVELSKPADREDSVGRSPEPVEDTGTETQANSEAEGTYPLVTGGHAGLGETLAARRTALGEEIERCERHLAEMKKEQDMIKAALFVYEADQEKGDA